MRTCIISVSASRRASPRALASRRSVPCLIARSSTKDLPLNRHRFLLELLRLEVRNQRVDERLEFAVHYFRQLVDRESNAVVGHAVLRKVIRAYLLAAIAAANLCLALLGQLGLLALEFDFVKTGAQNPHGLLPVLDLRLVVLAAYNRVGGNMRDTDGRVGSVYRLATRP